MSEETIAFERGEAATFASVYVIDVYAGDVFLILLLVIRLIVAARAL